MFSAMFSFFGSRGWRPLLYLTFCIYLAKESEFLSVKSQGILKTDVLGNQVKFATFFFFSLIIVFLSCTEVPTVCHCTS